MSQNTSFLPDKTFPSTDLTRNSSEILHEANIHPVTITQYRKPRYVMMSIEEYERLKAPRSTQHSYRSDELPEDLYVGFMDEIDRELAESTDD